MCCIAHAVSGVGVAVRRCQLEFWNSEVIGGHYPSEQCSHDLSDLTAQDATFARNRTVSLHTSSLAQQHGHAFMSALQNSCAYLVLSPAAYRSISVRSTCTTLLNANHSGMSSPARSISLNLVPDSFFVVRFSFSAMSAVT